VILDDAIADKDLRNALFDKVTRQDLVTQMTELEEWLTGKHSHVFHLVIKRFSYLRQFAPTLLKHLQFRSENSESTSLLEAVQLLQEMNDENRRKLPEDAPIDFVPKNIQEIVVADGVVNKCDQWDRMGHFYASLESGHATASTALKRLVAYSGKNHFYRANRELGRVLKTGHILRYMSDPLLRQRTRRGLLKGEQIHALARDVGYGKQGRITARDLQGQRNSCSCLTLIMACIIYWQAKEFNRVLNECDPESAGVDVSLLEHVSPIGWENIILYGEYVLNRDLIQL